MSWFPFRKDHQATIINADKTIQVKAGQDLLAAGLQAGLGWPNSCRSGLCGKCITRLHKGKIRPRTDFTQTLTPHQLESGCILACQSLLKTDVEVEVDLDECLGPAPEERAGMLSAIRRLTHDIVEIKVQCEKPWPDGMLSGQYAEISYKALSSPRNYSFARPPENEPPGQLSFYVRHVPGGEFTDWLFAKDRTGTPLNIAAPYGSFRLHESNKTMCCIAGGSGMSAVKAILEHACNVSAPRNAIFLFGARAQKDLYCAEEMESIRKAWNKEYRFEYIPVLSAEPENSDWQGGRGYVTSYLTERYLRNNLVDLNQTEAYMCGPPPMIDAGIKFLSEAGMQESFMYYDKFLDASNKSES